VIVAVYVDEFASGVLGGKKWAVPRQSSPTELLITLPAPSRNVNVLEFTEA
jgi:hypothetical protein